MWRGNVAEIRETDGEREEGNGKKRREGKRLQEVVRVLSASMGGHILIWSYQDTEILLRQRKQQDAKMLEMLEMFQKHQELSFGANANSVLMLVLHIASQELTKPTVQLTKPVEKFQTHQKHTHLTS